MEQLITAINNFVNWLQMPAWGFLAVTLAIGGYNFYTGAEGVQKGKKWIMAGVIGVVIVKLAQVLTNDLESNLNFGLNYSNYAVVVLQSLIR